MTRLTIELDWELVGTIDVGGDGRLRFPKVEAQPGLYRFWIETADERPGVYIGEARDLRRRMQHYRTPGTWQPTNLRMCAELLAVIGAGGRVTLWLATDVTIAFGAGASMALDLCRKNQRLVAEQAAIAEALLAEDLADEDAAPARPRLLNKPGVGETPHE